MIPSSPRTAGTSSFSSSLPVIRTWAERRAASITPPLAPKIFPAVVLSPKGVSAVSGFKDERSMPKRRIR